MIGLVRHIEYLLLHNDDVFIPGLGRFTVLCDEAKIQSGGTSFLPPVRKVAFESVATGDSGLLVRSVMRAGFIFYFIFLMRYVVLLEELLCLLLFAAHKSCD